MAKPETRAAWGIDIGLCGLKALKLKYVESANQVMAVAFDYVAHPKILSQPDANPEELIGQAIDTFLSRNSVKGDLVAISVPGTNSLAKFIQLPPVESSKVGDIVKYEAKQQIPFSLDEVIWDFQPLGSGMEEGGFMLDCEVGLFAMKKEHVHNQLRPFTNRKIEIDLIQIAPMALYSYLCADLMGQTPGGEPVEQEDHTVLLDMGADATTILVSNGKKIWLRTVHLGGNHFTRALTKEMKLTFAKAEHLKCNATKAPDPKAIFQALRPVFNDYAAEIQRSIGYFSSVNRNAKIKKVVGLGGGFKLAGLQKFLQQNLQMDVERVEHFEGLAGDSVLNAPLFQENLLSFGVPYGLSLQALNLTRVHTSLLPREIKTARLIRAKKPWAVAAAALVLAGLGFSNMIDARGAASVSEDRFGKVEEQAKSIKTKADGFKSSYDAAKAANKAAKEKGAALLKHAEGRTAWLEVYKAINECLPRDSGEDKTIDDPSRKHQVRVRSISTEYYEDLGTWYSTLGATEAEKIRIGMRADDAKTGPSGAGYVFTLDCLHFHHEENPEMSGVPYVHSKVMPLFHKWEVQQPGTRQPVPVRKMGLTHAAVVDSNPYIRSTYVPKGKRIGTMTAVSPMPGSAVTPAIPTTPMSVVPGVPGLPPMPGQVPVPGQPKAEDQQVLKQTNFTIQFVWKEILPKDRVAVDPADAAAQATAPADATAPVPADHTAPAAADGHTPAAPANTPVATPPAATPPDGHGTPPAQPAVPPAMP